MSSAILIGVFSLLEIYGHSCGEQDRGWHTEAQGSDLCLLPTHFKGTSGCGQREGAVVEGMPDSLEIILSLFLLPHLWASFEVQLEGNKLSHLQACMGLTVNVSNLQCSNSPRTHVQSGQSSIIQDPCWCQCWREGFCGLVILLSFPSSHT